MASLKAFIRKYFGFSESETNGFLLLIPLMVLLLFSPSILKKVLLTFEDETTYSDAEQLKEWLAELDSSISIVEEEVIEPLNFHFNPNKASTEDLIKLGFSKKTAERIEKYRAAGGSFKSTEDLSKIYGISETRVKELKDYVVIPKKKKPKALKKSTVAFEKPVVITKPFNFELNTTTADSLMKIKGIGPFFAKNIIELRNKLGGFSSLEQLKSVYKINEDVLKLIDKNTTLDAKLITPINLNSDSAKTLYKHPFISYKLAQTIIAYRKQHGAYENIDDLKNIKIVSDSIFQKLEPYLGVHNN